MWNNRPPCRGDLYCPLASTHWGYTVFLMFSLHPGGETLPFSSGRVMPLETAMQILEHEVIQAKHDCASAITVILRGGNPLDRTEDLLELAEFSKLLEEEEQIQIQLMFSTDAVRFLAFREEYHQEYGRVSSLLKAKIPCCQLNQSIRQLAPDCLINYEVTKENVDSFYDDIIWLAEHAKFLHLEWQDEGETQSRKSYFDQLKKLFADTRIEVSRKRWLTDGLELELLTRHKLQRQIPFPSGGKCYDTTGWAWPCPALSPLHLLCREMSERTLIRTYEEELTLPELVWTCPGKLISKGERSAVYQAEAAAERVELSYCQAALIQSQLPQIAREDPERHAFEQEIVRVLAHMIFDVREKQ